MRRLRNSSDREFTVDMWDLAGDRHLETLATASNLLIAIAAFDAAIIERPGRRLTLRHGIRVIRQVPGIRQPWDPS